MTADTPTPPAQAPTGEVLGEDARDARDMLVYAGFGDEDVAFIIQAFATPTATSGATREALAEAISDNVNLPHGGLARAVDAVLALLQHEPAEAGVDGWRSMDDTPAVDEPLLATDGEDVWMLLWLGWNWTWEGGRAVSFDITHWRPLPAPPPPETPLAMREGP